MNLKREKAEAKKFSLRLTNKLKIGVENKASELGISENAVISLAVSNYIKEQYPLIKMEV
ncbi:MAG: hypothetical protein H6Q69_3348 [Firmicutes bacterium]|jgi:predicted HicB family RNase H-like nuclease|nr:hypothetical protein [Bacillota bacterium]